MERTPITLDGLTPDEVLAMSDEVIEGLIVCREAIVFRAGTAEVLGRFWIEDHTLVLELGHIDGGGEGVLPVIASLAGRYARRRGLNALDWRVHAINCPRPNLKLRRLLERRGFVVAEAPGSGLCYRQVQPIEQLAKVFEPAEEESES